MVSVKIKINAFMIFCVLYTPHDVYSPPIIEKGLRKPYLYEIEKSTYILL